MKKTTLSIIALATLTVSTYGADTKIPVSYENYNQAETARNFDNWAKLGGDNKMLHLKELSPIGNKAPTIRMNLDTLYSVGVYDNDGDMTITIPESGLYQSIMILDTDGYTPFFLYKPGTYTIKHASKTLFVAVRTVVKDRHAKASFEKAYAAQKGIKVVGNGPSTYTMPAYDQKQLHKLTTEYNAKMLKAGIAFVYGDGKISINEEHRTWSNAAGWGGIVIEENISNYYTTSKNLTSDTCYGVTFPETGNKFFTSFTLYDTEGYLLAGNSHINSYTWEPNKDGSTTIHFNCAGKINNITANVKEFNYIVRSYGLSKKIMDEEINPVNAEPVK